MIAFSNKTKGDDSKSKKGRVVILVRDMSSDPVLHFYQVTSKYSKGYSSYRAENKILRRRPVLHYKYHKNIPKGL